MAGVDHAHAAIGPATHLWRKRENFLPALALLALTAFAWAYTLSRAGTMQDMAMSAASERMSDAALSTTMDGMEMPVAEPGTSLAQASDLIVFLSGWAVMMVAMMLPAAVPLILLYRTIARKRLQPTKAVAGMVALLVGYVGVWTVAGAPVYVYNLLSQTQGPVMRVAPGLLLIAGGVYQFTALKDGCHNRCRNPLFFLMNRWKPGTLGAARLGVLHGIDCVGCCAGLMVALVALGMMNVAWMLTAAVIIVVEKTLPGGHRVARPLGIALMVGGALVMSTALLNGRATL